KGRSPVPPDSAPSLRDALSAGVNSPVRADAPAPGSRPHYLRPHHLSKLAQDLGIDPVGLGQLSRCARKLSHPISLNQADLDSCSSKRLDQRPLITAAGFANHLHLGFDLLNPLDELPMARGIVRQTPLLFANGGVQMRLREIYS